MHKKNLGIYIHVPFCLRKCPYCNFYSVPFNQNLKDIYINTLVECLYYFGKKLNNEYIVDSIYFGGGTPSLLNNKDLFKIFSKIKENFSLKNCEVTLEINPCGIDNIDFIFLRKLGINRLSIGVQSTNDRELKLLGRQHTNDKSINAINLAKKAGFSNISVDIMINIPNQTKKSLFESLVFCQKANVQHVSAYMLKLEKGTQFYKKKDNLDLKDEKAQSEFYLYTCKILENLGFRQYEISNFAKPGFESKHNLKYWNLDEYLGIGPGAHSLLNGKRFFYESSIEKFLNDKKLTWDHRTVEDISLEEEYTMLRLRLSSGLENNKYFEKFNKNIPIEYFNRAKIFENLGFLKTDSKNYIKFTPQGYLVSNRLISEIIF